MLFLLLISLSPYFHIKSPVDLIRNHFKINVTAVQVSAGFFCLFFSSLYLPTRHCKELDDPDLRDTDSDSGNVDTDAAPDMDAIFLGSVIDDDDELRKRRGHLLHAPHSYGQSVPSSGICVRLRVRSISTVTFTRSYRPAVVFPPPEESRSAHVRRFVRSFC